MVDNIDDAGKYAGYINSGLDMRAAGEHGTNIFHFSRTKHTLVDLGFMVGRIPSSILWGVVADRWGRKPVISSRKD